MNERMKKSRMRETKASLSLWLVKKEKIAGDFVHTFHTHWYKIATCCFQIRSPSRLNRWKLKLKPTWWELQQHRKHTFYSAISRMWSQYPIANRIFHLHKFTFMSSRCLSGVYSLETFARCVNNFPFHSLVNFNFWSTLKIIQHPRKKKLNARARHIQSEISYEILRNATLSPIKMKVSLPVSLSLSVV